MHIYTLSDPHLALANPEKSMEKFGWENYIEKIKTNWLAQVKKEDIVLLPGDISWALKLKEAKKDLAFIGKLPGKKYLLKGNHDYWWTSLKKINTWVQEEGYDIQLVQYNAYCFEDYIISGVRGWEYSSEMDETNEKQYNKELARFDMCLEAIKKVYTPEKKVIFMMHYPPFTAEFPETPFLKRILEAKDYLDVVIFGHLHAIKNQKFYNKDIEGLSFRLVSADLIDFKLVQLF